MKVNTIKQGLINKQNSNESHSLTSPISLSQPRDQISFGG